MKDFRSKKTIQKEKKMKNEKGRPRLKINN
jgi:hypothetical protein